MFFFLFFLLWEKVVLNLYDFVFDDIVFVLLLEMYENGSGFLKVMYVYLWKYVELRVMFNLIL